MKKIKKITKFHLYFWRDDVVKKYLVIFENKNFFRHHVSTYGSRFIACFLDIGSDERRDDKIKPNVKLEKMFVYSTASSVYASV